VSNICVLFDFENINLSLQDNYQLSLTLEGFKKLIEFTKSLGNVEMKNFHVSAYWDNFKQFKNYVTMTGTNRVDVPINTKNAADGALIIQAMRMKLSNDLSKIDLVILFAGDGGYGSLIHYLFEEQKLVYICSVNNSTKENLRGLANKHFWIEDILSIKSAEDYNRQLCFKSALLPEWESVITKVKTYTKIPYIDKVFIAKQIFSCYDKHPPYKAYNTLEKCLKLVSDCCDQGLLLEEDRTIEGGKIVKHVKVNTEHLLLK